MLVVVYDWEIGCLGFGVGFGCCLWGGSTTIIRNVLRIFQYNLKAAYAEDQVAAFVECRFESKLHASYSLNS